MTVKERITITLDSELLTWLDNRIKDKTFANRSHGFEFLLANMMKKDGEEKEEY